MVKVFHCAVAPSSDTVLTLLLPLKRSWLPSTEQSAVMQRRRQLL